MSSRSTALIAAAILVTGIIIAFMQVEQARRHHLEEFAYNICSTLNVRSDHIDRQNKAFSSVLLSAADTSRRTADTYPEESAERRAALMSARRFEAAAEVLEPLPRLDCKNKAQAVAP